MKLFKKTPPPELPPGRRRAAANERPANPGAAFSYYAQRSSRADNTGRLDAEQAAERDQARPGALSAGRRRLLIAATTLLGLFVLYSMVLDTRPKVTLLENEATVHFLQDKAVYQQAAQRSLQASLFNRNKLTVDTGSLRLALLKDYPEIKNVSVSMPIIGHQPEVFVEPYKPSFVLATAAGGAFLLDATGRALTTTNQIPDVDHLQVPTVQDKSNVEVKLGSRALPSSTVSFIQTVVAALAAKEVTARSLTLPPGGYELDVAIAGAPYFVKFNVQGDALGQAGTFLATRQRLINDKITPAEYIDVRVAERAYYK